MKRHLRVAVLQPLCRGPKEEVVERAARMIARASEGGAEIACLPEHWLLRRAPALQEALPAIKEEARRSGVVVIAGAGFVEERADTFVESTVFSTDGQVLGKQRKVHLFGREKKAAKPGHGYRIFEALGVKFGVAVCHDLVYPEVARTFALRGADVIFAPALITTEGIGPWHLYLKARALENRIPIVSPNVLAPPRCMGGSMIVGLRVAKKIVYQEALATGGSTEKVLYADLDLDAYAKARKDRLASRRPDTYSALVEPKPS